jgi:hypothetical protein
MITENALFSAALVAKKVFKYPKYVLTERSELSNEKFSAELEVKSDTYKMIEGGTYILELKEQFDRARDIDIFAFEYVMYGKLFDMKQDANRCLSMTISFGGLMLKLEGDTDNFSTDIRNGMRLYLLLKQQK